VKWSDRVVLFPCLLLCFFSSLLAQSGSPLRSWIFLKDKGVEVARLQGIDPGTLGISERALKRRAKVLPADRLLDSRDLPVAPEYLGQLRAMGFKVHATSRWLNAVSVEATPAQIAGLSELSFVQSIEIVGRAQKPQPAILPLPFANELSKRERTTGIDYGTSITQLQSIKVPEVHNLGINGAGVLVGMIDDGFNSRKTHSALKNIRVLAEYDWIQADSTTSSQAGDAAGQGDHGCYTLSALAGFSNGNLVGPAFGATLILAKSEFDPTETQIELDNYVAALEWMERMGADVVSTSLGYDDLDPFRQFNAGDIVYSMKNGHTAVTSKAASAAASKGVLLVTAMGNEGPNRYDDTWKTIAGTTGSMITPADADSIVSVGAAFSSFFGNQLASFSSTGPTADGRVKPEVVAQGVSVVSANPGNINGYVGVSGTSLSTPLVGGVAALVFSAHPELTPMQVREALINTAVHITDPDPVKNITSWPNNWYGYGIVNAFDAILYHGLVFSNRPVVIFSETTFTVTTWIKSKNALMTDSLFLYFKKPSQSVFQRVLLAPTVLPDQFNVRVSRTLMDSTSVGYFSARDNSGTTRRSPFNAPDSLFPLAPTPDSILGIYPPVAGIPQEFVLHANYPNPFNGSTTILFDVPKTSYVTLDMFNLLGQRIRTIFSGDVPAGTTRTLWDGRDETGRTVASGVYFYRLTTPTSALTRRLLYIK